MLALSYEGGPIVEVDEVGNMVRICLDKMLCESCEEICDRWTCEYCGKIMDDCRDCIDEICVNDPGVCPDCYVDPMS